MHNQAGDCQTLARRMRRGLAPAGTPAAIVDRLQRDIAKIVAQPDVKEKLATLGFVPIANSPGDFGTRIKVEMEKWGKVVRAAKLRIE